MTQACVALACEDFLAERRTVPDEDRDHLVDQIGLLQRLILKGPEQALANHHPDGNADAGEVAPLLQEQAALRVGARVGPHQHHPPHPVRVP